VVTLAEGGVADTLAVFGVAVTLADGGRAVTLAEFGVVLTLADGGVTRTLVVSPYAGERLAGLLMLSRVAGGLAVEAPAAGFADIE